MAIEALLFWMAAQDPFARARADIDVYCRGRPAGCVMEQRRELASFVKIMAGFSDPGNRNARRCMIAAKVGKHADWTKAAACMRQAVKGRALGT